MVCDSWKRSVSLLNHLCGLENLLGPGPDPEVFRKVYPAHCACGVQQKLSWPRNILTVDSRAHMNQIIAANRLCFGIGKKSKCVPSLLTKVTRYFRQVYTNGYRPNPCLMELSQTFLDAPQLGVA
jgi:hypothetical protein